GEDGRLLGAAQAGGQGAGGGQYLAVGRVQRAGGPVGAEHQAVWTEIVQCEIVVRLDVRAGAWGGAGGRGHAEDTGELGGGVLQGGELGEGGCPRLAGSGAGAGAHVRVTQVVEDERQFGEPAGGGYRGRQVAGLADHVVGEARRGHGGQA